MSTFFGIPVLFASKCLKCACDYANSHLGNLRENRNHGPRPPRRSIGVLLYDTIHVVITSFSFSVPNSWSHFGQHAQEHVVARDVCLPLYKFHSHLSYFLSFRLCSLLTYRLHRPSLLILTPPIFLLPLHSFVWMILTLRSEKIWIGRIK